MIERVHRQIKDALRARQAGGQWPQHLAWVLLGLRSAPKEISGHSSAEAVYGQPLKLPGEQLGGAEEGPEVFASKLVSEDPPPTVQPRTWAQVAATPPKTHLMQCKFVYIRKGGTVPPLSSLYEGPFEVVQHGLKYFVVKIGGREEKVSVDRLKPHLGAVDPSPAKAPVRGRPKKRAA